MRGMPRQGPWVTIGHGAATARATVVPADVAVVLAMASHSDPRDHVHGKTHGNSRGGNVRGGNVRGKTPTWHPVPIWYFDPLVGPSVFATLFPAPPHKVHTYNQPSAGAARSLTGTLFPWGLATGLAAGLTARAFVAGLAASLAVIPTAGIAAGSLVGTSVGIAVARREYCRGVPWGLPFTVGLTVTCREGCCGTCRRGFPGNRSA